MAQTPSSSTGIGARIPRRELKRLLSGHGRYIDDIKLPRMLHACFVRSPHPHAAIVSIDIEAAKQAPGVAAVLTAADINPRCEPFVGVALHRPGHRSAPQRLLAADRAVWQGQPVAVVVADTRAEAEDAAELVSIEWEPLPAVADQMQAIAPGTPVIHPELPDNVAFDFSLEKGQPAEAFADADIVIEEELRFERQMAMTLETRGLIADFDPSDGTLTVIHAHQSPFQMQDVFSRHLHIPEHKVRVIAPDIGGAFGMKLNIYTDEIATVVASMILGRPVKFCVDRLESFVSDAHARDHRIKCRIAVKNSGEILAMEMDDLGAVGAYGMPLRFNVAEGMMAITIMGAPYSFENYKARTRSVYVNKNLIGMYRGVGMPLACIATELLTDLAADKLGIDTVEFKRRTYRPKSSLPCVTPGGQRLETVSFHECLDKLVKLMDYEALRKEQRELRGRGVYRGIGIATFCEQTAYGPPYYGPSGAPISTQDGCTLRLEPSGSIRCITSLTDQGQGTLTGIAQIVADSLGVSIEQVSVMGGDSAISPYGGGAWASRGTAVGGEAALRAGAMLKQNILSLAGAITQTSAEALDIVDGQVVNAANPADRHQPRRRRTHRILPAGYAAARLRRPTVGDRELRRQRQDVLHGQRRAGELRRGRLRDRIHQGPRPMGGRRLRPRHQSAAGGRAGARRHRAGHRRGALRGVHLQRRRQPAERHDGRLSRADVRRDARHRGGARRDARDVDQARRQGHRRSRPDRRHGGGLGCGQRCAEAVRRENPASAVHARTGSRLSQGRPLRLHAAIGGRTAFADPRSTPCRPHPEEHRDGDAPRRIGSPPGRPTALYSFLE